jgi:hypothetical protein
MLLFADDVMLTSDSRSAITTEFVTSVLPNLKIICFYKTKIIVFENGGHLSTYEKCFYNYKPVHTANGLNISEFTFPQNCQCIKCQNVWLLKGIEY